MTNKKIIVPSRLTFQSSINFVKNLRALEPHKEFNFDFSKELEQRLEMRKWSARSTTEYACTGGDCRGYIGGAITF
jgi:hypothetical protein